jgi:hypothetical protein
MFARLTRLGGSPERMDEGLRELRLGGGERDRGLMDRLTGG